MAGSYGGGAYGSSAYMPVTAQASFAGTMPYAIVTEIAFASNPLDDTTAVWTDVSKYVQSIQTNRGRQHELNRFEAGTATIALDNKDGRFSPFNTSSPYNPNVLPYKQVRVRALYNGVYYPIFRGHIESWPVKWPSPADSVVTVNAVDAFKVLNLKRASTLSSYAATVKASSPVAYFRMGEAPGASVAADQITAGRYATPVFNNTVPSQPTVQANDFMFGYTGAIVADPDTAFFSSNEGGNVSSYLSSQSDFGIGNGAFSVEFWVVIAATPSANGATLVQQNNVSFASGLSQDGWSVIAIPATGGTVIKFQDYTAAGGIRNSVTGAISIGDGKPHHVVCTSDSTHHNLAVYIDGIIDNSLLGANTVTLSPAFTEWGSFATGVNSGQVALDEVAFYSSAISATTITNHYVAGMFPRRGETTGARIGALLDAVGWPSTLRKIDIGLIAVQGATNDAINNTALANIQVAADTEQGDLFIGADGSVVFYDHTHKYKSPNGLPAAVLGDIGTVGPGGESPYLLDSVDIQFDDLDVYNQATVTPAGQGGQVASDSTSQTSYGVRSTSVAGIHNSNTDAANEANWLVSKFKSPLMRCRQVSFTPMSDPTVLLPAAMGFELLTRVTLKRRPKDGAGSTFTQDSLIEGISHSIMPDHWQTTWALSPTDAAPVMWIIGDPVAGKIVDGATQSPPVAVGF